MITSFRSQSLKRFWTKSDSSGLRPEWARKVERQLALLDQATKPEDMNVVTFGFHALTGDHAGMASRDPKRPPVHPGEILREDVLPGLGLSVTAAAVHLRITRQALHRVLAGSAAVSPEMALRIGKFCGNGAEVWLRMQAAYDLWHAQKGMADEIAAIPTQGAA